MATVAVDRSALISLMVFANFHSNTSFGSVADAYATIVNDIVKSHDEQKALHIEIIPVAERELNEAVCQRCLAENVEPPAQS